MDILRNKKFLKMLIGALVAGAAVVGIIIFVMTAKGGEDPKVLAQKEEAMKQATGYYQRIADLQELMKSDEYTARTAFDKILKELGIQKIDSIARMPKGQGRGNYLMHTDVYDLDVLMFGKELREIRIGKLLVYKAKEEKKKTAVVVMERVYTYTEYDTLILRFAKSLDIPKDKAARLFEFLTSLDITSFSDIKEFKDKKTQREGFKGHFGSIPLRVFISGDTVTAIEIENENLGVIPVYSSGMKIEDASITRKIPLLVERKSLADSLTLTIPMNMKTKNSIVFPIAVPSGDDTWFMVKTNGIIYVEVDGDIKVPDEKETTRKHFTVKLDEQTKLITYLKVDKQVYVGK